MNNVPVEPREAMEGGSGGIAEVDVRRSAPEGKWYIKVVAFLLFGFVCATSAEFGARVFWRLGFGVPFRDPGRVLYAYYPELHKVDSVRPSREDEFYDVLLLGGSVLNRSWGVVEQSLLEKLASSGHRNVRVFNLAEAGHTSRDSWLKYVALSESRFDLVVVYDGINDVRVNNAPPKIYREDYGHYYWYEIVNAMAAYHGRTSFALPYTLRLLGISVRQTFARDSYVPRDQPRDDWTRYGEVARSAVSLSKNVGSIIDLASERGDPLVIMTFAIYVPSDYSLAGFNEKHLDYHLHSTPLEIWGKPAHVMATVAIQNEAVRSLAAQHRNVLFVDQANLMKRSSRYFNDPCHLTIEGSSQFVENLLEVLLPHLKSEQKREDVKGLP